MADISTYLDKAHEQKEFSELAELPIQLTDGLDPEGSLNRLGVCLAHALQRVAEHKFIRAAQATTLGQEREQLAESNIGLSQTSPGRSGGSPDGSDTSSELLAQFLR